jgi:hypothetical protein
MLLFDDNIFGERCSRYETNHLHIYIDGDIDFEDVNNMTSSEYATLVHEYTHYIQHITTLCGIRISDMFNRMFSFYLRRLLPEEEIRLPLLLYKTDGNLLNFLDFYRKIKGDDSCSFNISDIEINPKEIEIANKTTDSIWIGCYDFDNEKAEEHGFKFGYRSILEGMSHIIQSMINPDLHHMTIPYLAVESIIEKVYPKILSDKKLIVSICLCSLSWNNPSIGFFEVLSIAKQHPSWNGKELYYNIFHDYELEFMGERMPMYKLVQRFLANFIESLENLMGQDLEYYSLALANCAFDIENCEHRLLNFIYDDDILNKEAFRENVMNHYGYPLIDSENNSVFPQNPNTGNAYIESAILCGVELIMSRFMATKTTQCRRYDICKKGIYTDPDSPVTKECLNNQWDKRQRCIFTETLRYFRLDNKRFIQ